MATVFNLAIACVLRVTTKTAHQLFEEKSAPQRKSWLRLCSSKSLLLIRYRVHSVQMPCS